MMNYTHGTDPVKLMPAKCGEAVIVSPNTGPSAGIKLTTPGGTPASRIILKMVQFDKTAVSDGFHNTALPINAGVYARLPPMAVKLNGLTAATKPSIPRYRKEFFVTFGSSLIG